MSHTARKVGIFGGTFDPIHYGHLRTALELLQILQLDEVRFVPCGQPVHKDYPVASSAHRLNMLHLAIEKVPEFCLDDREVLRPGSSYMIDTLKELREAYPTDHFYLLVGSDAFVNIDGWKQWTNLLDYAHIVIMMRSDRHFLPSMAVKQFLKQKSVPDIADLASNEKGCIYAQSVTTLDISSSIIRAQKNAGYDIRFLLPETVQDYIEKNNLY